MQVWSFRISFKKLASVSAAAAAVALAVIYAVLLRPFWTDGEPVSAEDCCIAYLHSSGWEVDPDSLCVTEVRIPGSFDHTYEAYNAVQLEQGFDLRSYAGERVKRYSYLVTNYPEVQADIRANLLVYHGKIVGGDISSMERDGFLTKISKNQP